MPFRLSSCPQRLFASVAVLCLLSSALPLRAQEGPGPAPGAYLAAGVAASDSDFGPAAKFYAIALQADPANPALLDAAVMANIALGQMPVAATLAQRLLATGTKSQTASVALIADDAKKADFAAILKMDNSGAGAVGVLDDLVKAWAEVGAGHMSDASAAFDKIAATKGLKSFGLYHKALALASAGDFEGADNILSGRADGNIALIRRGVIARIEILSQLEKNPEAIVLIDHTFPPGSDIAVDDLRRRLEAGEPLPFDVARNATEGIAEVFFSMASAVNGQTSDAFTLIHARAASYLRPDYTEAILLTAALLQQLGQTDLAKATFAEVPKDDPSFYLAEIGRANATFAAGDGAGAVDILDQLATSHGQILAVQIALGDALRRESRFAEAKTAYDAAIAMITEPGREHWVLFYSRGVSEERSNDFVAAEADLRKALQLDPNNPEILNYLGYSLVDRGQKLGEALDMIKLAAAGKPDSGAILDSLGWAYYRLGRYHDALPQQEKASLLDPVDAVVTDHLGDIYWAVGRKREAQYQWHRALSFKPSDTDAIRIRAKLDKGLDAVLSDEGAPPLAPQPALTND